jgi:hypothetical protein
MRSTNSGTEFDLPFSAPKVKTSVNHERRKENRWLVFFGAMHPVDEPTVCPGTLIFFGNCVLFAAQVLFAGQNCGTTDR